MCRDDRNRPSQATTNKRKQSTRYTHIHNENNTTGKNNNNDPKTKTKQAESKLSETNWLITFNKGVEATASS